VGKDTVTPGHLLPGFALVSGAVIETEQDVRIGRVGKGNVRAAERDLFSVGSLNELPGLTSVVRDADASRVAPSL
jgi:hypothetical protein